MSQTADLRSKEFREIEKLLQPEALRASFSAIRDAHTALKEYGDGADLPDLLSMFLKEATRSGASISDRHTRSKAQSILDYWSLRLAAIAPEKSLDAQLDEFVAPEKPAQDRPAIAEEPTVQAEPAAPQPSVPGLQPAEDNDQIAIRFAAAARLWRDTDHLKGFLLEGDALALGARFRERDPAIDALVTESENVIRLRRRRYFAWLVGSLVIAVIGTILVHSELFPRLAKWEARQAALYSTETPSQDEIGSLERRFARIAFYQRFMPAEKIADVFFTGAIFSQLDLRAIVLPAANFVQSKFRKVQFDGANLANSSFSETTIANVDFARANLSYANFRSSVLTEQTSFENANLYRANFDYTNLCGVSFAGARLKKASFRGVYLEDFASFARSGWWLASGWNSDTYNKLLTIEDSEQDIRNSEEFRADLAGATKYLLGTKAGTLDRASALNSYALVLASWGLATWSDAEVDRLLAQAPDCKNDGPVTDIALMASRESVCILDNPPQPSQLSEQIGKMKPIVYDALGYLQLQRGKVDEALASFEKAGASGDGDGGREFRYAVALSAAGMYAEALNKLEYSMVRRQYVPSHELKTLKHLLGGGDEKPTELLERILGKIDDPGSNDGHGPNSTRSCVPS